MRKGRKKFVLNSSMLGGILRFLSRGREDICPSIVRTGKQSWWNSDCFEGPEAVKNYTIGGTRVDRHVPVSKLFLKSLGTDMWRTGTIWKSSKVEE